MKDLNWGGMLLVMLSITIYLAIVAAVLPGVFWLCENFLRAFLAFYGV